MKDLWRLSPFLYKYRAPILLALVCLLCLTAAQLAIPTIIEQVIDIGLSGGEINFLVRSAVIILVIGLGLAGLTFAQRYLSEWIAAHIGYDLRNLLYDHIQHLPFAYHDRAQTGQLISRSIEDVRAVERFMGFGLVELIRLVMLLIGIIVLLFRQDARLAAISLIPLVPLMVMTSSFGRKIGEYFLHVDNTLGELSSILQENVTGVQVVRAFAQESYEVEHFNQTNRKLYHARITVISQWARIMPTSHFLVTAGTILVLWFGGQMILSGGMTIGEVVAFNSYLLLLTQPAQQLTWLVNLAGEAVAGVQRAYEVLDMKPAIQTPDQTAIRKPIQGHVTFENVKFRYQDEPGYALQDIDLNVKANQVIALIGPTGSGKTSLVNLIPRFYEVSHGKVCIDGDDVRHFDLVSLRQQIGIVLQTSLLFSTSIRENIAYGRPDALDEEIITAAKAAQAHDFICELPNGYNTIVGERGITLSGGQRQRVAIARALLLNPRILILDDSTSSVDLQTEHLIQKALEHLMQGRTTFVIAHRLSTVRRADLILVMEHGRIVESGKHHELVSQDGLYREIYELQLRHQEFVAEDIGNQITLPQKDSNQSFDNWESPLEP